MTWGSMTWDVWTRINLRWDEPVTLQIESVPIVVVHLIYENKQTFSFKATVF